MNISESNISLFEDHHQALKIWREKSFKNIDLVHVDAHIDFGFHPAKPVKTVMNEARSIKELKRNLEYSLAFSRYEKDLSKQTNIGNYIYPAMSEGIIKDFYWIIPGKLKEFKESFKIIKGMLENFSRLDPCQSGNASQATRDTFQDGIISTKLLGRKFVICILEKLPILEQKALLDIDTDFLIVDSLLNADNTAKIGKRKRGVRPGRLIKDLLTEKVKPVWTTIAYSVNGGYTPMRYKILGDELAYRLSPRHFKGHYGQKFIASVFFERFESTGKKEYYRKAVKLNPSYRAMDNNYGPLYLSIRKFSKAKKEFSRIADVDPENPHPFAGLGNIALEKRYFPKAKRYFSYALKQKPGLPAGLFGLARAEFGLKNFKTAKKLFLHHQSLKPLQPWSRYFLGCIYRNEKDFEKAVVCYRDTMMLGLNNIDIILDLLRCSCHIKAKNDIIQYASARYAELKKGFKKTRELNSRHGKRVKGFSDKMKRKIEVLENLLNGSVKNKMNIKENERIQTGLTGYTG